MKVRVKNIKYTTHGPVSPIRKNLLGKSELISV